MFKFPCKINISKLVMFWLGLILCSNVTHSAIATLGAIHSTKIPTDPTGKSGPPQKVDPFFRNFSGWTEPIH